MPGGATSGFAGGGSADVPEGARQGQVASSFLSPFTRGLFGIIEAVKFKLTDHGTSYPGQWTGAGSKDRMHILSPTIPVRITEGGDVPNDVVVETAPATGDGVAVKACVIGPVPAGEVWRVYGGGLTNNQAAADCDLDSQGVYSSNVVTTVPTLHLVDPTANITVTHAVPACFPYVTSINDVTPAFNLGYVDVPAGYYYGAMIGVDVKMENTKTFTLTALVRKFHLEV